MTVYRIFDAATRKDFGPSSYGYIIDLDGTIICLDELQKHGAIVYERYPEVRAYYDSLPEDEKNERKTRAELFSTEELGLIRISIAPYIGQWSVGTSRTNLPTKEQIDAMSFLVDVCGVEEMFHDRGEGNWRTVQGWMTKPNWGY